MDDQKENVEAEEQDEVTPEDLKTMPRQASERMCR